VEGPHGPQLIVPYTLDANDMRFATPQGFNSGDQFYSYLKDSFDVLYAEGATRPKLLSIGLHCRLAGRPGRAAAVARFLDYVQSHEQVWVATRLDIARHWIKTHPPAGGYQPSRMPRALFVERFGDIFEHTPRIAERAHAAGLSTTEDTADGLHAAFVAAMRALPETEKRALIQAHPDLGGRLMLAGQLTADSTREQGSAGLDQLSPADLATFTDLNQRYVARFGMPFIFAVKGRSKADILASFSARIGTTPTQEFSVALEQIERIALLRLRDRLP
jgi:OHCU decarboxylase